MKRHGEAFNTRRTMSAWRLCIRNDSLYAITLVKGTFLAKSRASSMVVQDKEPGMSQVIVWMAEEDVSASISFKLLPSRNKRFSAVSS